MKRKWIITAGVLLVFIAGAVLWRVLGKPSSDGAGLSAGPRGQNTLHVNGEVVRQQLVAEDITTIANLLPDEEVDLSFETSGKITGIEFQEGTFVHKGQLLARINDAPLRAQLSRYEAQLKLAEARVSRQSALLAKDAVSQEAYEQVTTDLATLNADIDLVRANIAQTELRAPFDGIIGLRNVSEGAYVTPSVVIVRLTKISPLKLEFPVPEQYASELTVGDPLTFTPIGSLDTFDAKVYATETRIDIETRTFTARASYPNPDGKLLPGYFTRVALRRIEIPNALSVPSESLIREMGIDKVYLYKDGKAQPQTVRIGIRTAARVQVIDGLQPGDTLITSGTLQLRTGMPVVLDEIN
jgi:membrane fusion protein (multidrug efflux system)